MTGTVSTTPASRIWKRRVDLADEERRDLQARAQQRGKDHRADNEDVPAHHQDDEPGVEPVLETERHIKAHEQRLVGHGIEIGADARLRMQALGEKAVQRIRHARDEEKREREPVSRRKE